jgi:hypothetical protein
MISCSSKFPWPATTYATGTDPTHGTAMAEAILRAIAQASGGSTSAQILPVNVYSSGESTTSWDVALGIQAAVDNGANVLNLSLGGSGDSSVLDSVIQQAIAAGIPIFAAAGNQPVGTPTYPAADSGVMAVTRDAGRTNRAVCELRELRVAGVSRRRGDLSGRDGLYRAGNLRFHGHRDGRGGGKQIRAGLELAADRSGHAEKIHRAAEINYSARISRISRILFRSERRANQRNPLRASGFIRAHPRLNPHDNK